MSETLTFNQINKQNETAYLEKSGAKPSVLIRRTDGRITVANYDIATNSADFYENGPKAHPDMTREQLSDQYQEQLAAELAGVALRGSHEAERVETTPASREVSEADSVEDKTESLHDQIAAVETSMDAFLDEYAGTEQGRVAMWQYAIALHDAEKYGALAQLQEADISVETAMKYKELFIQLSELRQQLAAE